MTTMTRHGTRPLRRLLCRRENRGIAALEFGILAPLFAIIFAGTADLGTYLHLRMRLTAAVSAGANYALINPSQVASANNAGKLLAENIAAIVANSVTNGWADVTVVVNNGPTTTVTQGAAADSGTAANADLYYCPTGSLGNVSWGSPVAQSSTCTGGTTPGKFVTISATRGFTAAIPFYAFIPTNSFTAHALVQTQ